jgi:hypothetical protein
MTIEKIRRHYDSKTVPQNRLLTHHVDALKHELGSEDRIKHAIRESERMLAALKEQEKMVVEYASTQKN